MEMIVFGSTKNQDKNEATKNHIYIRGAMRQEPDVVSSIQLHLFQLATFY
jgi:hypothetical protein